MLYNKTLNHLEYSIKINPSYLIRTFCFSRSMSSTTAFSWNSVSLYTLDTHTYTVHYTFVYVCTYVHAYVHTYVHTYVCMYMYIYNIVNHVWPLEIFGCKIGVGNSQG